MSLRDNVTGIRVNRTTLSRMKILFPKFCKHGETMDILINRMCKVCELLDEEQVKAIVSNVSARAPRRANTT